VEGIYFDSIDNSQYILGKAPHSARNSWVYVDGEVFQGVRADVGGDPNEPWVHIAWKYLYTAKDSWLGAERTWVSIGAMYNLTMDPFEKYEMYLSQRGKDRRRALPALARRFRSDTR
jgi:arylsulfatase